MQIVIDSNILFAALIKDSLIRKILFLSDIDFIFPYLMFEELEKYKSKLVEKSKLSNQEFNIILDKIKKRLTLIETEHLIPYRKEAFELVKEIDPKDYLFIACSLYCSNCIFWSDDKALKKQNKIKVLNTLEIIDLLNFNSI